MNELGYNVVAVDFDGCLCTNKYPEIGEPNNVLINILKENKNKGHKIILWTCRVGKYLDEAVVWCAKMGLTFDAVNDNLPEVTELFGSNSRKIWADVYIDDRALNEAAGVFYRGKIANYTDIKEVDSMRIEMGQAKRKVWFPQLFGGVACDGE